jgi:hypothetical protein
MTNLVEIKLLDAGDTEILTLGATPGIYIEPVVGEGGLLVLNVIASFLNDDSEVAYIVETLAAGLEHDGVRPVWNR